MKNTRVEKQFILSITLLNLSGLGLGYVWLQEWPRFALNINFVVSFGSFVFNNDFSNRQSFPIIIFSLFILVSVIDSFFQAKKKVNNCPKVISDKRFQLMVIAFFVITLEIFGICVYQQTGENLYQKAKNNYETYNFIEASINYTKFLKYYGNTSSLDITKVKRISQESDLLSIAEQSFIGNNYQQALSSYQEFMNLYPDSDVINEVFNRFALSNKEIAEKLISEEKYSEGIKKYQIYLQYSLNLPKEKLQEKIISQLIAWARTSKNEKEYISAIEKFRYVNNLITNENEKKEISEELSDAYIQYATSLMKANNFEEAIKVYQILEKDYKNTNAYKNLNNPVQFAYIDWGKYLRSQRQFIKALEIFDNLIKTNKNLKEIYTTISNERKITVELFSRDTGIEGKQEIDSAVRLACTKKPVASEIINHLKKEPGKAVSCGSASIPSDIKASIPGTLRYAVFRENGSKTIQTCPYEGGYSLKRVSDYSTITVNNVQTGRRVASITIYGTSPASCGYTHLFHRGVYIDYLYGSSVSESKINDWLKRVIK